MTEDFDLRSAKVPFLSQLGAIVRDEPPTDKVVAIYFGIFAKVEGKRPAPQFHLLGTVCYDEANSDWACLDEDSWLPAARYFRIPEVERLNVQDWQAVQADCRELIMASRDEVTQLVGTAQGRPIALGWDDGDLEKLFIAKR